MCGRGHISSSGEDIQKSAESITSHPTSWENGKSWDNSRQVFHPGCEVPVIFRDTTNTCTIPQSSGSSSGPSDSESSIARLTIAPMTWGLVPSFTKVNPDIRPNFFRYFNARSETCSTVNVYSRLLKQRRCVVCLDGFFEWTDDWKKEKQPYYIKRKDKPLFIAALYDITNVGDGTQLRTVTLLTTSVCNQLKWLHDRMPVILSNDDSINKWLNLNPTNDNIDFKNNHVFKSYNNEDLVWYPVSKNINKIGKGDDEKCIEPVKLSPPTKITSFFSSPSKKKPTSSTTTTTTDTNSLIKVEKEQISNEIETNPSTISSKNTSKTINQKRNRNQTENENENATEIENIIDSNQSHLTSDAASSSSIDDEIRTGVCPDCTYLNQKQRLKCEICGAKLNVKSCLEDKEEPRKRRSKARLK
mmetsp:Transcript_47342/g.60806  ORF Transcript_47342/g.60806 Transcript_47342/m.60806 type:complete len:416 (-) Transcript_47342:83-1330(-)